MKEPSESKQPAFRKIIDAFTPANGCEAFLSQDGDAFGTIAARGKSFTLPLNHPRFAQLLLCHVTELTGEIVGRRAVDESLEQIEGALHWQGTRKEVFVRLGGHDGHIYIDLGDDSGQVVKVSADGWGLTESTPVRFYRPPGLLAMPAPERTDQSFVDLLRPFVSAANESSFRMLVAWIVGAFKAEGPYPILSVNAQQGAGKSSLCEAVRSLIDPNGAPTRGQPKRAEELLLSAKNSRVVAVDNLSGISPWMSDVLCRISTGGGISQRQLYADCAEVLYNVQRPIMLNSIDAVSGRGDLLSRTVVVELAAISAESRQTAEGYKQRFADVQPKLFGALLDVLVGTLRKLPSAEVRADTRMSDWARWMDAAEGPLGWTKGNFVGALKANQARINAAAIESNPLAQGVLEMVTSRKEWKGSMSELLEILNNAGGWTARRAEGWPGSPEALGRALRRLEADLHTAGVDVAYSKGTDANRTRLVMLYPSNKPKPVESPDRFDLV